MKNEGIKNRDNILQALQSESEGLTRKQLVDRLGISGASVGRGVKRLMEDDLIHVCGYTSEGYSPGNSGPLYAAGPKPKGRISRKPKPPTASEAPQEQVPDALAKPRIPPRHPLMSALFG